jgi:hypothetical protein
MRTRILWALGLVLVESNQWILGHSESDKLAASVGGCDDADLFVVDFASREIWTCQWGP